MMNFLNKLKSYISFESERDIYPETFQQELNYQCGRVLTFASLMTLSWLPYIPIDMQLYPSEPLIVVLRICFPVIGLMFVTASICYLDLESGLLRMASAGHPPVTVLRKNGNLDLFKPKGKMINDIMPADYLDTETMLGQHDKVILYTDGITEAFSKTGEMFGDERLNELLKANRKKSPEALCELIIAQLKAFTGSDNFEDDITMLATEYYHTEKGSADIPDVILVQRAGKHAD